MKVMVGNKHIWDIVLYKNKEQTMVHCRNIPNSLHLMRLSAAPQINLWGGIATFDKMPIYQGHRNKQFF